MLFLFKLLAKALLTQIPAFQQKQAPRPAAQHDTAREEKLLHP